MALKRGARALAASLGLLFAAAIGGVSCGSDATSDAAYDEYFSMMAAQMSAFESKVGVIMDSQVGLADEALSASYANFADELDMQASAFGDVDAPNEVRDAHREFVVAFRSLADVKILQSEQLLGVDTGLTSEQLTERESARSGEWFDACHELQDIALVRDIEADLKCVTALHR